MTELHALTATEQVEAIASRTVSSRELVEHYLDRISRHDPSLRAFVTVLGEQARQAATAADEAVASGDELGPLHGLPLALKDMHASAGMVTSFGSAVFKDLVPPADAPAVANLRAAGAVVVGKTNVPEFGPTCYTDNDLVGATANPYDNRLTSRGAWGGAPTAVAAGLIGLAHGSDGLGSIRTPAATCGLVGFKTSRGRSAGSGAGFLALAVEGPLARTVADAALFLDAMGGPANSDLWQTGAVPPDAFRVAAATPLSGPLRIGWLVTAPVEVDVHPDCLAAVDVAAAALVAAGHEVVEVPAGAVPTGDDVRQAIKVILSASLTQIVELAVPAEQRHLLMPYTRWLVDSFTYTATEHATAQAVLAASAVRFRELLYGYDLILCPTTSAPPPSTAELRADDGPESLAAMGRWSAFTPAANMAGLPAVSLPVHHTADGVPIGVQLIGHQLADELLMSLAAQLEPSFRWQDVHPPIWDT